MSRAPLPDFHPCSGKSESLGRSRKAENMEGPQVSNRSAKTHRRQMRPVTPVARATRGTAGVAFAATFVLTGTTGALADGTTQADAAAESANIIAPVTAPAVTIPAAQKHDDAAFGVFAAEAATLKPKAPVVAVDEADAHDADAGENTRDEDSRNREDERSNRDEDRSNRDEERSNRNNERSNRDDRNQDEQDSRAQDEGEARDEETEEAASPAVAGSSIFATAKSGIGVRYKFGGSSRSGWDCSGFTSWVYRQHGINLPHSAGAQARMGKRISKSQARPGDLVYYPGHVGIYAGNGMILDAGNSRKDTSLRKMWKANWSYHRIVD